MDGVGSDVYREVKTDPTMGTEVTVEDQLAPGLKLTIHSLFCPNTAGGVLTSDRVQERAYQFGL